MGLFRELLSPNSDQSAGRFGFLYSVLLSNSIVWYTWLLACLYTRSIVDIPVGVYTAYGIANGMAFAGKGIQTFAERPASNTQVSTSVQTTTRATTSTPPIEPTQPVQEIKREDREYRG